MVQKPSGVMVKSHFDKYTCKRAQRNNGTRERTGTVQPVEEGINV